MAEEKRAKAEPLVTDEWKPRGSGRGGRKRQFGLLVKYGPTTFARYTFGAPDRRGEFLEWKRWYPTERAREQAMTAINRKKSWGNARYSAEPIV